MESKKEEKIETVTYNTIEEILKNNQLLKFDSIQKISQKMDLYYSYYNSIGNYLINKISCIFDDDAKKNITFAGVYIKLNEIFIKDKEEIYYNFCKIKVCVYNDPFNLTYHGYKIQKNTCKETTLFSAITDFVVSNLTDKANKIMYIPMDMYGYGHTEGEEDEYDTHSSILIIVPINRYNYRIIFINPHGSDVTYDFDNVLSSRRVKKTKYNYGIDSHFMEVFAENINRYAQNYFKKNNVYLKSKYHSKNYNHNSKEIKFIYKPNRKHMYRGANLQTGDIRGFCYVFPGLIYYYIGLYYSKPRIIGDKVMVDTVFNLLRRGDITKFAHAIMCDFSDTFKEKVISINNSGSKKNISQLDEILQEEDYRYIKRIASSYVTFIKQKIISNQEDDIYYL